jgi:hypothetical protein
MLADILSDIELDEEMNVSKIVAAPSIDESVIK